MEKSGYDEHKHNLKLAEEIFQYYKNEIKIAPCSQRYHLAYRGGLKIHSRNVLEIARKWWPKDEHLHCLALLHDIGKARQYLIDDKNRITFREPQVDHHFHSIRMINGYLLKYGSELNDEEVNAIQFHHGGWSKFNGTFTELAIKLHACDLYATHILDIKEETKE